MIPATAFGFATFELAGGHGLRHAQTERIDVTRARAGAETGLDLTTPEGGEAVLILMHGEATLETMTVSGTRMLAILPATSRVSLSPGAEAWCIAPRALPGATAWRRLRPGPAVYAMDTLPPPPDNPRLKMLQTDKMSLNWVRYDGPRDRRRLSPHLHADFPQAGLALEGDFVHHLRTPWGPDSNMWREDVHHHAASPSLIDIPAGIEHTSEGNGGGWHLLVDLFQPPRADYIAKGWVLNSSDYAPAG